jgi:endonuclease YncB( thermonuclease family)
MLNSSLAQRLLIFLFSCVAAARADKDWVTYNDCRYLPNAANDGDSFHVRAAGREYIFRLYFVDAPETDAANPARLIEQAKHFGISVPQAIEVGEAAKEFIQEKLALLHHPHPQAGCPRS